MMINCVDYSSFCNGLGGYAHVCMATYIQIMSVWYNSKTIIGHLSFLSESPNSGTFVTTMTMLKILHNSKHKHISKLVYNIYTS